MDRRVLTAVDLLEHLRADGFELAVNGGRLRIRPADRVTADLRESLAHHRTALLNILRPPRAYVTLKGGPTVPVEPVELALEFERRGIRLATDSDHQLVVPDHDGRLTEDDRASLQRWRHHLGAILEYQAPEIA
jgi:hypothetical protein